MSILLLLFLVTHVLNGAITRRGLWAHLAVADIVRGVYRNRNGKFFLLLHSPAIHIGVHEVNMVGEYNIMQFICSPELPPSRPHKCYLARSSLRWGFVHEARRHRAGQIRVDKYIYGPNILTFFCFIMVPFAPCVLSPCRALCVGGESQ